MASAVRRFLAREDGMSKLFKTLLLLVVLVAAAAGVYALTRGGKNADGDAKMVTVEKGSVTEKALAVGQIQPRQKFSIKSKISGIVKKCMVNVGDKVKAGDPLLEIAPDPTPQELTDVDRQLDSTRASLDRAKADFERSQQLSRDGVLPKSDLDVKREAYELAKVAVAKAEQQRDLTRNGRITTETVNMESIIRAPAAGTVLSRAVNPGDPVVPLTSYQPGTELAAIADMSDLIFKGTVDEIDVGKLHVDLPARIKVGALPTDVVTGKVARIAPQAQQKDGATLFDIEIELDSVTKVTLRAGYSANADLIIREKKDVLTIPERVVIFEDGGKKTFVELPAGKPKDPPKKTAVTLGISDGLNVEVAQGLSLGAKVLERPPKKLTSAVD
jgi:HlyD family secretion protein